MGNRAAHPGLGPIAAFLALVDDLFGAVEATARKPNRAERRRVASIGRRLSRGQARRDALARKLARYGDPRDRRGLAA